MTIWPHMLIDIDSYLEMLFAHEDDAQRKILAECTEAGLPHIQVSPTEGKLLAVLTAIIKPDRVLEIGTLGGYSTSWLASGLDSQATITTIESNPKHARVARASIKNINARCQIELVEQDALLYMQKLISDNAAPYDLIFIDADKQSYPAYLRYAIQLSHTGTVLLSDNLIRNGQVIDPSPERDDHQALARFNRDLSNETRMISTVVPLINRDTMDGLGISVVTSLEGPD